MHKYAVLDQRYRRTAAMKLFMNTFQIDNIFSVQTSFGITYYVRCPTESRDF